LSSRPATLLANQSGDCSISRVHPNVCARTDPSKFGGRPLTLCFHHYIPLLSMVPHGPAADASGFAVAACNPVIAAAGPCIDPSFDRMDPRTAGSGAGQKSIDTGRDDPPWARRTTPVKNCGGYRCRGPPCWTAHRGCENGAGVRGISFPSFRDTRQNRDRSPCAIPSNALHHEEAAK